MIDALSRLKEIRRRLVQEGAFQSNDSVIARQLMELIDVVEDLVEEANRDQE